LKSYLFLPTETKPPLPPELAEHIDVRDPEALIERFLQEFTEEGDVILDPFAGFGTALKVAQAMNRVPYGIEYDRARCDYARSQIRDPEQIVHGDARRLESYALPKCRFSISSPPFMGRNDGEDPLSAYSVAGKGYERYLEGIRDVYRQVGDLLADGGRAVLLVSNLKLGDGLTPLAFDVARIVSEVLSFEGEVAVVPEGGFAFGYDHYYCLIFRKPATEASSSAQAGSEAETALPGNVSEVARVGETIRRSVGPWSPAAHAVLRHLERVGFDGAPRFLGIDDKGREILSRLDGYAPPEVDLPFVTEERLAATARLLRELHEALNGFRLPPGVEWDRRVGSAEGDDLPVCHLDIHPPNIVFRDGTPVGFIDWDSVGPAPRVWEIARAAWLLAPLSCDARCRAKGWAEPPDRLRRLRIFCEAYDLPSEDRRGFAQLVIRMAQAHSDQVRTAAQKGVPSARWLAEEVGYPHIVERDIEWMRQSAQAIDDALK
jgi:hypothetical protein